MLFGPVSCSHCVGVASSKRLEFWIFRRPSTKGRSALSAKPREVSPRFRSLRFLRSKSWIIERNAGRRARTRGDSAWTRHLCFHCATRRRSRRADSRRKISRQRRACAGRGVRFDRLPLGPQVGRSNVRVRRRLGWLHNRQPHCAPCIKSTNHVRRAPESQFL